MNSETSCNKEEKKATGQINMGNTSEHHIPFNIPSIGEEEIQEVAKTLRSGWITTGPRAHKFEKKFSQYIGAEYAIAVNSCTAGLHLGLVANNIAHGDEVITTPYTFAATGESIIHCGAKPVFADIENDGFNIDPESIESKITSKIGRASGRERV